jgi:hypothetical protein
MPLAHKVLRPRQRGMSQSNSMNDNAFKHFSEMEHPWDGTYCRTVKLVFYLVSEDLMVEPSGVFSKQLFEILADWNATLEHFDVNGPSWSP